MNVVNDECNKAYYELDEMAEFLVEAFIEYHEKLWEKERIAKFKKAGETNASLIDEHIIKIL